MTEDERALLVALARAVAELVDAVATNNSSHEYIDMRSLKTARELLDLAEKVENAE